MFTKYNPENLPKDFIIGCATASYQIEGATKKDGRSPSIWDEYPKQIGRVHNGEDGSTACDHYNRMESDLDLMKELNFESYRFSLAWPRIIPDGFGKVNEKGLDFYERLIDGILERGLIPNATLYHWDLPECLEELGGWRNRDIVEWFGEYVSAIAKRLGDRLSHVATFNELTCVAHVSHLIGEHAPGYNDLDKTLAVIHNTLLSHGNAVKILRELIPTAKVGIVNNSCMGDPLDPNSEADLQAVERRYEFFASCFTDPIFLGRYPKAFFDHFENRMPEIKDGDMELINQPLDFFGLNYYHSEKITADDSNHIHQKGKAHGILAPVLQTGFDDPQCKNFHMGEAVGQSTLKTAMGWSITPWGLRRMLNRINDDYGHVLPAIYVTENGLALEDFIDPDGSVHDPMRIEFTKAHLEQCDLAIRKDNVPLKGYYCWSFMDNYEWSFGYSKRFGMVFCNYKTQARIPKDSAKYIQTLQSSRGKGK